MSFVNALVSPFHRLLRAVPWLAWLAVAAALALACGAPAATATPTPAATPQPTATAAPGSTPAGPAGSGATVQVVDHPDYGPILADGEGMVLYLFTRDEPGKSNCSGGCLQTWPPLLTDGGPAAGDGVDAARLGTITLGDGSTMVTYHGWPLYYFASDTNPGDAKGQNVGGVWYVVSPAGEAVRQSKPSPSASSSGGSASYDDPYY